MHIKIWNCSEAKEGKRKMRNHIFKKWSQLDFKHSWNSSYSIDSDGEGKTSSVFCNCGEVFYQESGWD